MWQCFAWAVVSCPDKPGRGERHYDDEGALLLSQVVDGPERHHGEAQLGVVTEPSASHGASIALAGETLVRVEPIEIGPLGCGASLMTGVGGWSHSPVVATKSDP